MTDQEKRIKLAEAMGAVHRRSWDGQMMLKWPDGRAHADWHFNPFTDANADYAVLEWMRGNEWTDKQHELFRSFLGHSTTYRIGDYARAALKVIE